MKRRLSLGGRSALPLPRMFDRDAILSQARRRYCEYLQSIVTGEPFFPLKIILGKSRRSDVYEIRRAQLAEIREAAVQMGFEVNWVPVADPRFGTHERPEGARFACEATFLKALGKVTEVSDFRADLALIIGGRPELRQWVRSRVQKVVQHHGKWPRLLTVVNWLLKHEACGLYMRQLPIPGVDTKFMESNLGLIDDLLVEIDPRRAGDPSQTFHQRHGLRVEESQVRIRFLDLGLRTACGLPEMVDDCQVPCSSAGCLPLNGVVVFITENLRNFLALPYHPHSIALLGYGDASARLQCLPWLASSKIQYWGDLDAHGFGILARLRVFAPHATSFLMDLETLEANKDFVVDDITAPAKVDVSNLNVAEQAVYRRLTEGRLRLEQERVAMDYVLSRLNKLSQQNAGLIARDGQPRI